MVGEVDLAEVQHDLASIGLDNLAGFFEPAVLTEWVAAGRALQSYAVLSAREADARGRSGDLMVVDVRGESEWLAGHIPGAHHFMLGYLTDRLDEIPAGRPVALVCSSGNRSAIGASILQAHGFGQVSNLSGGFDEWLAAGLPITRPT
jgi:hydroxyacylglutathione hydrolase